MGLGGQRRQVGAKLRCVQVAGRWVVVRPVAQVEGVIPRGFNAHLEKEVTVLVGLSFAREQLGARVRVVRGYGCAGAGVRRRIDKWVGEGER